MIFFFKKAPLDSCPEYKKGEYVIKLEPEGRYVLYCKRVIAQALINKARFYAPDVHMPT